MKVFIVETPKINMLFDNCIIDVNSHFMVEIPSFIKVPVCSSCMLTYLFSSEELRKYEQIPLPFHKESNCKEGVNKSLSK